MGGQLAHQMVGLLPDALAEKVMQKAGIDRLNAFYLAIDIVRRGGTISLIGVYGGMADPLPMPDAVRQADPAADGPGQRQALVDDIMPLLQNGDPLGVDSFATHRVPIDQAPDASASSSRSRTASSRSCSSREPNGMR